MPLRLTRAVKFLLIANLACFLVQQTLDQFFGTHLGEIFSLVPSHFINDGWLWQILTYSFLHGSPYHLIFNMLMLVFVAGDLESGWGIRRFSSYYAFCVLFSGVCYLFAQLVVSGGLSTPMVGASGGIFGLLLAYGLIFAERSMLFMMLFPMKAKVFVWILAGIEFMTLLYSPGGGLSSVAHLGGMAGGFIFLWISAYLRLRKQREADPSRRDRSKSAAKHLRLVISNPKEFEKDDKNGPKTWH